MDFLPDGVRTCLYPKIQLDAVIDAMAWQASGFIRGKERVILVGILRRGAPLAEMLYTRLVKQLGRTNISMLHLQIKRYADDLSLLHPETKLTENPEHLNLDLTGATVLVVDDVMYHGHSMLRAVEYLATKQAA